MLQVKQAISPAREVFQDSAKALLTSPRNTVFTPADFSPLTADAVRK